MSLAETLSRRGSGTGFAPSDISASTEPATRALPAVLANTADSHGGSGINPTETLPQELGASHISGAANAFYGCQDPSTGNGQTQWDVNNRQYLPATAPAPATMWLQPGIRVRLPCTGCGRTYIRLPDLNRHITQFSHGTPLTMDDFELYGDLCYDTSGNQQIIRKHTAVALQKAADTAATEPRVFADQTAFSPFHDQNDPQPSASDDLVPPSQPHHRSSLPSEPPFHVPRPDQAKSAALEALEEILRTHTQPLEDERTKAKAAMAEAQEYANRLAAEIAVEQERVRQAETEREEQARQLDQARNTIMTVMEARRTAEHDKLDTEQILAEERQHAETLVREKAEAHEEIRRLTHHIKKLEQEIQEKSEQAEQAIEAKNEAIGRAERAESDRSSADEKALLALGLANDCCTSAKKSEALQKEERERAEEAERDLEHALQRQNEQEKEIELLRAEKARGNDTVIARGAEVITPAAGMREATSRPRRSKRRRRASSKTYDEEREVGSSEPDTKRVAPLLNQLRQLRWAEWERGASRLIHFDIQVSIHPTAEVHDVRPGSCSIKCIRYEEENVISNYQIATVLEMIYRKNFNQQELSIIGQTFRKYTFRTITASEYNSLFEAEVDGPIILVLWEKFPEFITEVTAGIRGISE